MRLDGGVPVNTSEDLQEILPVIPQKKQKSPAALVGGGLLLVIFLIFVWRIVFFYVGIVRGTAEIPTSFLQSLTVDASIGAPLGNTPIDTLALATLDDPNFGANNNKALLTIVEFADFGCPYSREASYMARALANHTNLVRYVYRDFPITSLHPGADIAAEAGECAQEQNRFFDYHDKVYQNQSNLSQEALERYAQELGMDNNLFVTCLESHRYASEVEEDRQAGIRAGVRGTPTFFLNGARIEGAIPQSIFTQLLNQFIASHTQAPL
ncbi:TPA: hypothetical protein DEB00_01580 [Candidatus Uhrbacteria bacterium]|nr:hypothetical protein [Candidatus Uhrbacteria bacterium]